MNNKVAELLVAIASTESAQEAVALVNAFTDGERLDERRATVERIRSEMPWQYMVGIRHRVRAVLDAESAMGMPTKPRTIAGWALLNHPVLVAQQAISQSELLAAITAIEEEALSERLPECPDCDSSWAEHRAGMHKP